MKPEVQPDPEPGDPPSDRRSAVVLDSAVQRLIDASADPPYLHELGPVDGREALLEAQGDRFEDFDVAVAFRVAVVESDLVGFTTLRPKGLIGKLPVILYVHGGRWMLGDAQTHAYLAAELAIAAGAAVVMPEYTRTPEARYPTAIEECYATMTWVVQEADKLDLDTDRLALAGDCAGATIATAMTMLARRRGGPRISGQLLYYPVLDARCDSTSQREFATGHLLTRDALRWYWEEYIADPRQQADPIASPQCATREDLEGLPRTLIITAEADVTRDEGEHYARRLRHAGVPATALRFLGTVHDFVSLSALRDSPPTQTAIRQGGDFLRGVLHSSR
jgi:acetyl esterase/lipase